MTNIGIFSIWGKKNGPGVQALHCLFVVGMLLAPVISRPFLSNIDTHNRELTDNENSTALGEQLNKTVNESESQGLLKDEVDLTYPYLIAGILTFISAVIFAVSMFITKKSGIKGMILTVKSKTQHNTKSTSPDEANKNALLNRRKIQLTVLVFFFIFAFCTAEVLYGMFLVTFIVQYVGLSNQKAADIASVFFFVTIASRAAGVFIITKVKPVLLIFCGMSLTIFSAVLFYFVNEHIIILWVAACLAAWGSATQYPSTLTWVSEYTEVKGYVGTALLVSNALGYFIGPFTLGLLFNTYEISAFLYVLSASLCLKFIAFAAINVFLKFCWKDTFTDNCEVEMDEIATKDILLETQNKV